MSPGIAHILCAGAFAQIGDAVITALIVDVIDFAVRVLAVDMKPGEPMRAINDPADSDVAISLPVPIARFAACACAAASHPPIKKPRLRGVIEQFSQALGRQLSFQFAEHEGTPKREAPGSRSGLRAQFAISVFSRLTERYSHRFSQVVRIVMRIGERRFRKARPQTEEIRCFPRTRTTPGGRSRLRAQLSVLYFYKAYSGRRVKAKIPIGTGFCRLCLSRCLTSQLAGRIAQGGGKFRQRVISKMLGSTPAPEPLGAQSGGRS